MSFSYLPSPIYIAVVTVAGISLIYAFISRYKVDSKLLCLVYLSLGLNSFIAVYIKIIESYFPSHRSVIPRTDKLMYAVFGVSILLMLIEGIRQAIVHPEKRFKIVLGIFAVVISFIVLFDLIY